jgi:hypothetical protein
VPAADPRVASTDNDYDLDARQAYMRDVLGELAKQPPVS